MNTEIENILKQLTDFGEEYSSGSPGSSEAEGAEPCSIQRFTLLLSGISSCRRVPGIERHMGFEELYHCEDEAAQNQVREHLGRMYGITDQESLEDVCGRMFRGSDEYAQFQGFWENRPPFDLNELNETGRQAFARCMEFAQLLRPVAGSQGFFAWDYNERIGLYRLAAACGLLSDEEFWQICIPMAKRMAAIYNSFGEFACSCLCGAVYFLYCENGWNPEGLDGFFDINRRILVELLSEGGAWAQNQWFQTVHKKYMKSPEEIRPLLMDWTEAEGCFATDRIVVDGCNIGYMYREEPNADMPDSGWRFFAGDESDEYANNADYVGIYRLNTLCNYDPDILPLLHAPYGTAYVRDENGVFQKEPLVVPE